MKRPFVLRVVPAKIKTALYYRFYRARRERWRKLFSDAPLQFAPGFSMQLLVTDEGHGDIAFTGFYELPLSRRIAADARSGGLLVDVGAITVISPCCGWPAQRGIAR